MRHNPYAPSLQLVASIFILSMTVTQPVHAVVRDVPVQEMCKKILVRFSNNPKVLERANRRMVRHTANEFGCFDAPMSMIYSPSILASMFHTSINFTVCETAKEQIYLGLGSIVISIIGKEGQNCIMEYGGEIENPDWDGTLDHQCKVPMNIGTQVFENTDAEVDLTSLHQYCSSK